MVFSYCSLVVVSHNRWLVPLVFWLLWDHFGHDRAKNGPGSFFSPVKYLIAGLLYTHSGFVLGLHWSGE